MNNSITVSDVTIRQDSNGLYNLNDFHKAAGAHKNYQPANFMRLDTTKALCSEIDRSSDVRNAFKSMRGGKNQGTYACKELVYAYAMWISPAFHLKVIRTFDEVVQERIEELKKQTQSNNLMLPWQKNHLRKIIKRHCYNTTDTFPVAWGKAHDLAGGRKIQEMLQSDYPVICRAFGEEPMEGGDQLASQDKVATTPLKETIDRDLAKLPDYTNRTMALEGVTRTNVILKHMEEHGFNVRSARKEQHFLWRQMHHYKHVADHLFKYCKNLEMHMETFQDNLQRARNYYSGIEDEWLVV